MSLYKGLRCYLPLDSIVRAGGTVWDMSGNYNMPWNPLSLVTVDGDYGNFTGGNYLTFDPIGNPVFYEVDEFSVFMQVYFPDATTQIIFGEWSTGNRCFLINTNSTGYPLIKVSSDGTTEDARATSTVQLSANTWYNILAWADGTNIGIRVEATENTAAFSSTINHETDNDKMRIGYSNGVIMTGRMKDFIFWNRGLTSAERDSVIAGWLPDSQLPDTMRIALVLGQSNAGGQGDVTLLANPNRASRRYTLPLVRTHVNDSWQYFHPAVPGSMAASDATFGPEVGIAETLPSDWAIFTYGPNGQSIDHTQNEWYPDDATYADFEIKWSHILSDIVAAGCTPDPQGILWVQGEADASDQTLANNWQANAQLLFDTLRAKSNIGSVPIVLCRLHTDQNKTYIDTVIAGQDALASANSYITLIDTSDWLTLQGDSLHFDEDSLVQLGRLAALEMLRLSISDISLGEIAEETRDAILNRVLSGNHDTAGTTGKLIQDIYTDTQNIYTDTNTTIPAAIATAQSDLDTLTGADGVTLATSQPNYAPNTTTPPTATAIADAVLSRGVSNVEATADEHSLCFVVLASSESSTSGSTWTVKKTTGDTFATKTVTTDADADPITGVT